MRPYHAQSLFLKTTHPKLRLRFVAERRRATLPHCLQVCVVQAPIFVETTYNGHVGHSAIIHIKTKWIHPHEMVRAAALNLCKRIINRKSSKNGSWYYVLFSEHIKNFLKYARASQVASKIKARLKG